MRGPSRRSAAIVTGRLVLVAIAAAAAVTGFLRSQHGPTPAHQSAAAYTCPMHPEVVSATAGDCPICRMALVRTSAGAPPQAAAGTYTCPMHPEVVSATRGDCPICRMALVPRTADGTEHAHASHDHASPEEPTSLTLPPGTEIRGFDTVSRARVFDMALEMRASASADGPEGGSALFHLDAAELLRPGEKGYFSPSSGPLPGSPLGIPVRIAAAQQERWDRSTVLVRFEVEPGAELAAGAVGVVKLSPRLRKGLVVRSSAVLHAPEGPYVLVVGKDRRTLTRRPVEIGSAVYGHVAIVSGLQEGEYALSKHAFVLDSERRLVRRSSP